MGILCAFESRGRLHPSKENSNEEKKIMKKIRLPELQDRNFTACFPYFSVLFILLLLTGCIERKEEPAGPLTVNGNVDNRQMNVAFLISERVAEVYAEEGNRVEKGELLASLETVRLEKQAAEAEADVETARAAVKVAEGAVLIAEKTVEAAEGALLAAKAELEKAENGSRAEDILLAEAALNIIDVQLPAAKNFYERNQRLRSDSNAVSAQDFENAQSRYEKLTAEKKLAEANLEKVKNGPRDEEKAAAKAAVLQAEAQLGQTKAQLEQARAQVVQTKAALGRAEAILAIRNQSLADCRLIAPCSGIIRNRILEPGELASPHLPAFTLALVSPKWVRVYVEEPELPQIRMGMRAEIRMDGRETPWTGWVGFISPNAEFTPKTVETRELRTSLVYEVRVFVEDEDDILKLGAPVSVKFSGPLSENREDEAKTQSPVSEPTVSEPTVSASALPQTDADPAELSNDGTQK